MAASPAEVEISSSGSQEPQVAGDWNQHVPEINRQAGGGNGLPTTMDPSAWPIVHGTKQSTDASSHVQPTTGALAFFNSQSVTEGQDNMAQMLVRG